MKERQRAGLGMDVPPNFEVIDAVARAALSLPGLAPQAHARAAMLLQQQSLGEGATNRPPSPPLPTGTSSIPMWSRPAIFLHERHVDPKQLGPANARILHRWKTSGLFRLYTTPSFVNDDLCWLYAAILNSGSKDRPLYLVSNDEMRDHHFSLLAPRPFLRWRALHQVKYRGVFAGTGGAAVPAVVMTSVGTAAVAAANGLRIRLDVPPRFATWMQRTEVPTAVGIDADASLPSSSHACWHVPCTNRDLSFDYGRNVTDDSAAPSAAADTKEPLRLAQRSTAQAKDASGWAGDQWLCLARLS
jgi:hypothetical protein